MKCIIEHKLLAFSFFFVLAGGLNAADRTWDSGGGDGFFKTSANWDGAIGAPISDTDTLQVGANLTGYPYIGFNNDSAFRTPSFTFLASANFAYSVREATGNDSLTLTGTGVALQNLSPARQEFFGIPMTVGPVGSTTQTWDGGTNGLILSPIDLGSNVLTIAGGGVTSGTRNVISGKIAGNVASSAGVTKTGAGILLFDSDAAADYLGATTILNGTLQLGRKDQIPDGSKLVLNGGTFDTGGFSDTMATLKLGGTATINFGISNIVELFFGDSHSETWSGTLTIMGFTSGADKLRVGLNANALSGPQLALINFNGTAATITDQGFVVPIPEPSVLATLLSGLGVLGFYRRHWNRRATT